MFVHRWQTGPSPRRYNHGRGQPQENVLLGRMGEGSGQQRQSYNCEKVGIWPNLVVWVRSPVGSVVEGGGGGVSGVSGS